MTIFNRIKSLFHSVPAEQILGYSIPELRRLFQQPRVTDQAQFPKAYPKKYSLESRGIQAFYTALLLDKRDVENFLAIVNSRFVPEQKRQCADSVVVQSRCIESGDLLCYAGADEFEGHVFKLLTNSLVFLAEIDQRGYCPPPPWVAFPGYNPEWWGGSMQGAQGYFDDNYFSPFFRSLDAANKKKYSVKYGASPDWEAALALFYDDDEEV